MVHQNMQAPRFEILGEGDHTIRFEGSSYWFQFQVSFKMNIAKPL